MKWVAVFVFVLSVFALLILFFLRSTEDSSTQLRPISMTTIEVAYFAPKTGKPFTLEVYLRSKTGERQHLPQWRKLQSVTEFCTIRYPDYLYICIQDELGTPWGTIQQDKIEALVGSILELRSLKAQKNVLRLLFAERLPLERRIDIWEYFAYLSTNNHLSPKLESTVPDDAFGKAARDSLLVLLGQYQYMPDLVTTYGNRDTDPEIRYIVGKTFDSLHQQGLLAMVVNAGREGLSTDELTSKYDETWQTIKKHWPE